MSLLKRPGVRFLRYCHRGVHHGSVDNSGVYGRRLWPVRGLPRQNCVSVPGGQWLLQFRPASPRHTPRQTSYGSRLAAKSVDS